MGRLTLREALRRITELESKCARLEVERAHAVDGITSGVLTAAAAADEITKLLVRIGPLLPGLRADRDALNTWIAGQTGQPE